MGENWQPGDLALCIDDGPSAEGYQPPELEFGRIYTVYAVGTDPHNELGLFLDELDSRGFAGGYLASRFRKVDLPADDIDRAVVELLKQPAGEPA